MIDSSTFSIPEVIKWYQPKKRKATLLFLNHHHKYSYMNKIYSLIAIAITITSCQHVYYAPNSANAPQLSEKGETRLNALYCAGGDSEFSGGELQAAHAVSDKVGVMINFFAAGTSENVTSISSNGSHVEKGNGSYIEGAGGYFMTLD